LNSWGSWQSKNTSQGDGVIVDSNLLMAIACHVDEFVGCRGSWAELHPRDECVKVFKGYGDRDGRRWRARPRPPKKHPPIAIIAVRDIANIVADRMFLRELIETAIVSQAIAGDEDGE
jgi:hypothetical protein